MLTRTRGNPFDLEFCLEFSRVATACDENRNVRAVLITGAGRYFTVGADLKTMTRDRDALPVFIKNASVGLHSAISGATALTFWSDLLFYRPDAGTTLLIAAHAVVAAQWCGGWRWSRRT